jgi:hypothetical protein
VVLLVVVVVVVVGWRWYRCRWRDLGVTVLNSREQVLRLTVLMIVIMIVIMVVIMIVIIMIVFMTVIVSNTATGETWKWAIITLTNP